MATWSEEDIEPKAPDKNDGKCISINSIEEGNRRLLCVDISGNQLPHEEQNVNLNSSKSPEEKELQTLDEGQLKALLDEAITYKNPKDREGKSELFKELLQEVEADESENKDEGLVAGKNQRYYSISSKRRHHRHFGRDVGICSGPSGVGVSTTRGGSLQNLHSLTSDIPRARGRRCGLGVRCGLGEGQTLVSARQREGGSLPSNVNVQGRDIDAEMDVLQRAEMICSYTSRATLEVTADRKREETTSNVDLAINFPVSKQNFTAVNGVEQNPLQLGSGYNSVKSLVGISTSSEASARTMGSAEAGTILYPVPVQHVSVLSIPPQILVGQDPLNRVTCETKSTPEPHPSLTNAHNLFNKILESYKQKATELDSLTLNTNFNKKMKPLRKYPSPCIKKPCQKLNPLTFKIIPDPRSDLEFKSSTLNKTLCPKTSNRNICPDCKVLFSNKPQDLPIKSKPLDENGNALGSARVDSANNDRKNKRRPKTKIDRNTVLAENIEGHRGEADIDTLMKYIESDSMDAKVNKSPRTGQSNGARSGCKVRAKEDEPRQGKRRSRDSTGKLHKCNSLEEISKTKLEDLTEGGPSDRSNSGTGARIRPKKQATLDDAQLGGPFNLVPWEDQLYSDESGQRKRKGKKSEGSIEAFQDSEFHVVTKKQRKKKRRAGCSGRSGSSKGVAGYYGGRGFLPHDRAIDRDTSSSLLYRYHRNGNSVSDTHPRRKSASSVPPSEKSDSSDLDSVHSLPVSSSTSRNRVNTSLAGSGGSTPQASYADITRSVTSPPRAISHGNISRRHLGIKMSPSSTVPSSTASSGAGDEESAPSPEPIHTVTFVVPSPSCASAKKDAMTDTDFDIVFPHFLKEEYPPLEKKSVSSDLFVEFTVKRNRNLFPRESSVSVEETIVLKNVSSNLSVTDDIKTDTFSLMKSKDLSNNISLVASTDSTEIPSLEASVTRRPPVILVNEPSHSHPATELTFGFEVNEQLLQSDEPLLCNVNKNASPSYVISTPVSSPVPSYNDSSDNQLDRIIYYVRHEWEEVEKDLCLGKAVYYSGQ